MTQLSLLTAITWRDGLHVSIGTLQNLTFVLDAFSIFFFFFFEEAALNRYLSVQGMIPYIKTQHWLQIQQLLQATLHIVQQ